MSLADVRNVGVRALPERRGFPTFGLGEPPSSPNHSVGIALTSRPFAGHGGGSERIVNPATPDPSTSWRPVAHVHTRSSTFREPPGPGSGPGGRGSRPRRRPLGPHAGDGGRHDKRAAGRPRG